MRDTVFSLNRRFYDRLWSGARLVDPVRFNTWPLVEALARDGRARLEVAPGLRPRLPIADTHFLDISMPALSRLAARGGRAALGTITEIPFAEASFDLVCACDVVEHVDDDRAAFAELARVARPGAALLISVPLHPSAWTAFDRIVGHRRRYEPSRLTEALARAGFSILRSASYGMKPRRSWLVDRGMWYLENQPERAMWWYNRVLMPLALCFERPLRWRDGFPGAEDTDTILLLCRKELSPACYAGSRPGWYACPVQEHDLWRSPG
jgi:SAM-dependent methyltransferase